MQSFKSQIHLFLVFISIAFLGTVLGVHQVVFGVEFTTPVTVTGDVYVDGALSKGSGTFAIDHPLYPSTKLLYHSFVESPDAKNIYDGIVTLDKNGEAVVELPEYYEVLNTQSRFLLTPIGAPAPALYIIKEEVTNNQFTIAGGPAHARVSWQVTGIRQDPFILANPIIPEVDKGPDELVDVGEYLFEGYVVEESVAGVVAPAPSTNFVTTFISSVWKKFVDFLSQL